ncbi:hypothetical protein [Acinetobacter wuhouensis]|uniref:Uncharacterized protein n=1 Tax=Acinetobacter wuhouensis TaxID=1879050 RepID=A0A4Q7AML3_9GAMM|nr:hypothetical protein [Acinetobacter wuhouensis]RZG45808.1 hypothetical protein EXU28_11365 [Acinetobacter wuhouensis]
MKNNFFILLLFIGCNQLTNAHSKDIRLPISERVVMNSQNMCDTLKGLISITKTNKLNSVKILGPFQRHILKDGQVGRWGMYMLPKETLGIPGKIVLYLQDNKITDIILSPSAKHHFNFNLFLNERCLKDQNLSFVGIDEVESNEYKFVNIFSLVDNGFKFNFRFFSDEKYFGKDISFNRLTIKIQQ